MHLKSLSRIERNEQLKLKIREFIKTHGMRSLTLHKIKHSLDMDELAAPLRCSVFKLRYIMKEMGFIFKRQIQKVPGYFDPKFDVKR
jgi:hypothetical protein